MKSYGIRIEKVTDLAVDSWDLQKHIRKLLP
jgi:hypothetical protein